MFDKYCFDNVNKHSSNIEVIPKGNRQPSIIPKNGFDLIRPLLNSNFNLTYIVRIIFIEMVNYKGRNN